MISVEEALDKILSYLEVLEPEEKPILDCLGQVLAADIYSTIDIPPMDNSAMDGYALRAEDTSGASSSSPRYLKVIGEVAAGYLPDKEVKPGTAVRIMTGAPLPAGADAVVPFEDTDEENRKSSQDNLWQIGILCQVEKGSLVRYAGEDIARESLALGKGQVLRPQEIGVLATLGHSTALVIRRPVISILATGDELIDIDQPLPPGKIHNSNSYIIAAQVIKYGGIPKILGIGRDSLQSLNERINEGLDSDMLITSGGVSRGDYDIVKDILAKRGEIAFWTVCIQPGKPLAFGTIEKGEEKLPLLGLPGTPVSSMVAFEQFARPALLKMMGKRNLTKLSIPAIIENDVKNINKRRIYDRVLVTKHGDQYYARLTGSQHTGFFTSMVRANGLVIIPEDTKEVKAGDTVQVQMLDW